MPYNRRTFIQNSIVAGISAGIVSSPMGTALSHPRPEDDAISLALWSLIRSFRSGVWKLTEAHKICREDFGIDGIEYVTNFFESPVEGYLRRLNKAAEEHGVKNVLIMVDNEGDMVAKDKAERMQAAINHRKWIEIAAYLGCHAIRCNARGGGASAADDPDALNRAAESFSALIDYAKEFKINVVIENHGGLSSDPKWLPQLVKKVGSDHFGILPDYGNYLSGADIAEAVRLAMPYAKGVSVKAAWMPDGTHPAYDLSELLKISKDLGYTGFWGIESSIRRKMDDRPKTPEAIKKDDWQAVLWTKAAIEKVV
jgi:sugar phosphate isomerase/epimerase